MDDLRWPCYELVEFDFTLFFSKSRKSYLQQPRMHALNTSRPYEAILTLDGMDAALPAPEEQVQKQAIALANLTAYIERCGGKLPEGWECAVRCRLTTRSNGRHGLTSDNFYYSPCGRTFRSHRQVAEFLGLPTQPPTEQQRLPAVLSDASVVCDSDAPTLRQILGSSPASTKRPAPAGQFEQPAAKRPAVATTAAASRLSTPVSAAAVTAASAGMSGASCQTEQQQQQSMPPPQPVRRTKQMLAAKYAGCGFVNSGSTTSCISSQQTSVQCGESPAPLQQQQPPEPLAQPAAACAIAQQPTASASISGCTTSAPAAVGDSSRRCSSSGASSALTAATWTAATQTTQQQRSSKQAASKPSAVPSKPPPQQQQQASQPYKPKRQPEWRTKLRLLATQMAASNGVLSSKSTSSGSALDCTVTGPAQQQPQQQ